MRFKMDLATLNDQHQRYVLDPVLALAFYGPDLIFQLNQDIELWISRELWHILNNTDFYLSQPKLLLPEDFSKQDLSIQAEESSRNIVKSLKKWQHLRQINNLRSLNLFWIGDSLRESFLPYNTSNTILERWEELTHSLDERLRKFRISDRPFNTAIRDSIALVATLESAVLLTCQNSYQANHDSSPLVCVFLETLGFECQFIPSSNPVATKEYDHWKQFLNISTMGKFILWKLELLILHLVLPNDTPNGVLSSFHTKAPEFLDSRNDGQNVDLDSWEDAQFIWYQI